MAKYIRDVLEEVRKQIEDKLVVDKFYETFKDDIKTSGHSAWNEATKTGSHIQKEYFRKLVGTLDELMLFEDQFGWIAGGMDE